jgi:predicted esterase
LTADQRFEAHQLSVSRTARWLSLGVLGPATADVWIVLHGYGQLAATFAATATWPMNPHRAFVFPEAMQRFYHASRPNRHAEAAVGASWMTREAREDDIADNHAYLDVLWTAVRTHAPNAALTAFGFSQGGHTAARWAALRAVAGETLRLVLWGSVLPAELALDASAPLRRVDTTLVYGTTDAWISAERLEGERARLAAAGFPASVRTFDGGHRLDDGILSELGARSPVTPRF